jgi:K+-sensing histidine kinase KdpD
VPNENFSVSEIEAMLDPTRAPGAAAHRGLALALRLGRSIVELHDGDLALAERPGGGAFVLHLPTEA